MQGLRFPGGLALGLVVVTAFAAEPPTQEVPQPAKAIQGAWKQNDTDKVNLVLFEPGRMVQFKEGQLRFSRICYEEGRVVRVGFAGQKEPLERFEVKEGVLTFRGEAGPARTFKRCD